MRNIVLLTLGAILCSAICGCGASDAPTPADPKDAAKMGTAPMSKAAGAGNASGPQAPQAGGAPSVNAN